MAKTPLSVMLWTLKGSIEKKFEVAAAAGCESVELVGEHLAWNDARMAGILSMASGLKLRMDTLSCTPNWGREAVSMLDPEQRPAFLKQVAQAMVHCDKLNIPMALLMSGNHIPGRTWEEQYASLLEGAKRAGDLAAKAGRTLIIEPLNSKVDHRGFFLSDCTNGIRLCREANHPAVGLLFDLYHEQVQQGNVTRTLEAALPYVKVVHIADNPGRHEPGTGEMSYQSLYRFLKTKNYNGYVTMEFLPSGEQTATLSAAVRDAKSMLAS